MEVHHKPKLIGRSSSHFTRVTRIFAAELGIDYSFQVVRDLMSCDERDYGGHPALKVPSLSTSRGLWFGALNICRELSRQSSSPRRIIWPEALVEPVLANAQELVVQAMTTEVSLIIAKAAGMSADNAHQKKMNQSLSNVMSWLEQNTQSALEALPADRDLSYLEVTLFCLVTHLEFRDILPVSPYPALTAFCERFSERASATSTAFRFDA